MARLTGAVESAVIHFESLAEQYFPNASRAVSSQQEDSSPLQQQVRNMHFTRDCRDFLGAILSQRSTRLKTETMEALQHRYSGLSPVHLVRQCIDEMATELKGQRVHPLDVSDLWDSFSNFP